MNLSKNISLLNDIKSNTNNIYIGVTENKSLLSTSDTTLLAMKGQLSSVNSELDDILVMDTNINTNLTTMS